MHTTPIRKNLLSQNKIVMFRFSNSSDSDEQSRKHRVPSRSALKVRKNTAKAMKNARRRKVNSFHEKAGESQSFFPIFFFLLYSFRELFPIQPSRLCRHPSIRTLG